MFNLSEVESDVHVILQNTKSLVNQMSFIVRNHDLQDAKLDNFIYLEENKDVVVSYLRQRSDFYPFCKVVNIYTLAVCDLLGKDII